MREGGLRSIIFSHCQRDLRRIKKTFPSSFQIMFYGNHAIQIYFYSMLVNRKTYFYYECHDWKELYHYYVPYI